MAAIALSGVSVQRCGVPVLSDVDLCIEAGERIGLLAPSGTGKTALLRVMAGLEHPVAGSVEIMGHPVGPRTGELAIVFQDDAVYEHLDVEGNLAFPLEVGPDRDDRGRLIDEAARRFFLASLLDRPARTLSAGQRKAVAAARAVTRPEVRVVLLDDPLTGADRLLRARLVEAILRDAGLTVVFATREGEDVLRWGDRVVVLADGRIAQDGSPADVYRSPASLAVAEAMGELNRIPATATGEGTLEVGGSRLSLGAASPHLEAGRRVVIGVRPSALRPAGRATPFNRRLRGTVGRIEQVGPIQRVLFGLGGTTGVAFCGSVEAGRRVSVGERVDWEIDSKASRVYDPTSGLAL